MEFSVATVKVDLNGLWRGYNVGFDFFASGAVLGDGSAEDHQAVFRHLSEEFKALRDLYNGVLNVLSGGGGLDVRSSPIFVVEHGNHFADLATGRHIQGDEFGSPAFFRG